MGKGWLTIIYYYFKGWLIIEKQILGKTELNGGKADAR